MHRFLVLTRDRRALAAEIPTYTACRRVWHAIRRRDARPRRAAYRHNRVRIVIRRAAGQRAPWEV